MIFFCHAIRISDPLSIKIAVGIIGGGLPLIFIVVALTKLGEFWARQREATVLGTQGENAVPDVPDHGKESDSRRSRSTRKSNRLKNNAVRRLSAWPKSGHCTCKRLCPLWVISRHMQCKKSCPLYPQ